MEIIGKILPLGLTERVMFQEKMIFLVFIYSDEFKDYLFNVATH